MGHRAGQDIAGLQGVQIVGLAHPLRLSTGKPVHRLSGLVGVQRLNDKAGGAAYPGQYGNVPHGAVLSAVGALGKGHHGLHSAQLKPQLTLDVKGQSGGLQALAAGHSSTQLGGGHAQNGSCLRYDMHASSFIPLSVVFGSWTGAVWESQLHFIKTYASAIADICILCGFALYYICMRCARHTGGAHTRRLPTDD